MKLWATINLVSLFLAIGAFFSRQPELITFCIIYTGVASIVTYFSAKGAN